MDLINKILLESEDDNLFQPRRIDEREEQLIELLQPIKTWFEKIGIGGMVYYGGTEDQFEKGKIKSMDSTGVTITWNRMILRYPWINDYEFLVDIVDSTKRKINDLK